MDNVVTVAFVVDTFLLLLIGVGPKIVLLPFLEVTAGLDRATKQQIVRRMIVTAGIVSAILLGLGELLTRLLHFSPGALSVAGGIVLLIISIQMILGSGSSETPTHSDDPMALAAFPLAVPYLLNPAGIVALVTQSAESSSVATFAVVAILVVSVLAIDFAVLIAASNLAQHLHEHRMLVAEKVFGFLLAALAVQLILNGLSDTGVIHLTSH